mgnify:CR=1 FL=1
MSFLNRYKEYYSRNGEKFEIFKGNIWREYNKMVMPLGPVKFNYSLQKEDAEALLQKFSSALLVRCTNGFNTKISGEWYAIICNKFRDISELSAKNRSEIKRGFKNCKISMVDAKFIAENGFEVYISAFERYKGVKKPSITEKEYRERMLQTKDFDDIIHYWGVFYGDKLIGYSQNYIFDKIEVNYSTVKFDPKFLSLYPSYALFYTMNKSYLEEEHFEYVNDGFRNILHETNIQKYLIDKFSFQRAYTDLNIFYRPYLSIYLTLTFPFRGFLRKISRRLDALYTLEEIRRNDE